MLGAVKITAYFPIQKVIIVDNQFGSTNKVQIFQKSSFGVWFG